MSMSSSRSDRLADPLLFVFDELEGLDGSSGVFCCCSDDVALLATSLAALVVAFVQFDHISKTRKKESLFKMWRVLHLHALIVELIIWEIWNGV